ncbi:MAG: hypothetical protein NMNS01_07670 [Nitrosomonas sp.]|nr:MAG: hypothetical protein NMNS01_07670 [Nitrosomonas sp.]
MQIGDDARLAGRDIIDGRIGSELFATAQQFRLSGEIMGNARKMRRVLRATRRQNRWKRVLRQPGRTENS